MSSWFDIISLVVTLTLFVGVIVGVIYVANILTKTVENTKDNLKKQGINITDKGVAVKTSGRMDREHYIDATQKAFVDGGKAAMKASSFGKPGSQQQPQTPPELSRTGSNRSSRKLFRSSSKNGVAN